MEFALRELQLNDWSAVRAIYEAGIATGQATFETSAPDWDTWNSEHLQECRLVAVWDWQVIGWAALSPVSDRCVYAGVAEVSIYVAESFRGHGIGRTLLTELIQSSEQQGIWTLQAGIFPENKASIALHQACGFRVVGRREHLGKLRDVWRDVILLERRSSVVGC